MQLNLNHCFPESPTGTRGPLPKQAEFLKGILDPKGPKYLLYCGGIGSGKTMIGCIAVLTLAILYPGDYLIARQFLPQLKDTTLKTFLSICPKELILEHRVADGIVRVKSSNGRTSDILFRQLEEPDKLRSLNLSGFYVDESSQVSETAFMLLQGRLRGPGLRKGFLTTNPNGHDWQYSWFVKQDMFNVESAKAHYKLIKAPSTENVHLPDGYVSSLMATWSPERIKREIEGSFDAFEGMVYHEFRRDTHVVQPFVIPKEWTRIIGIDHGYRNPACWIWGAIDYDENIYIYREFYQKEWLIEEICKGKAKENKPGVIQLMRGEKISNAYIDPSTRAVRAINGLSDYDAYIDNLPDTFPMGLANNEKTAGIDRVKTFLKINSTTNKPRLFIFNTCTNLIDEMSRYRYKELTPGQEGRTNEKEEPLKVDDHACIYAKSLVITSKGPVQIQDIKAGDLVLTRAGYKPVEVAGFTGTKLFYEYSFNDGSKLIATPDHPIITNLGKIPINGLTTSDTLITLNRWQKLFLTGLLSEKSVITIVQTGLTAKRGLSLFIEKFGNTITGRYLQNVISTIKTAIPTITRLAISNALINLSIYPNTLSPKLLFVGPNGVDNISTTSGKKQNTGTPPNRGWSGTDNTDIKQPRRISQIEALINRVSSVLRSLKPSVLRLLGLNTVTQIVSKRPLGHADVYNLQVKDQHEFYANGVLVSNCDALRYLIMSRPEPPKDKSDIWKKIPYSSLTGSVMRELQSIRKPEPVDPFGE